MFQIVYESAATRPITKTDISDILTASRVNNAKVGVTGMLIYHEGMFIQALEGPKDAVEALYQKIEKDPRHEDVWMLAQMTPTKRSFAKWNMGIASAFRRPDNCTIDVKNLQMITQRIKSLRHSDEDSAYTAKLMERFLNRLAPGQA